MQVNQGERIPALSVNIQIDSEKLQACTQHYKQMPDEMRPPCLHGKRNCTDAVCNSTQQGQKKQRKILNIHFGYKCKCTPSQDEIHGRMQRLDHGRPKYTDNGNAGRDQDPLGNEQNQAQWLVQVQKKYRCEGPSDQKID